MKDYEVAETELRALLATLPLSFAANPTLGSDYGERGTCRFSFTLADGSGDGILGEWSCGSAIPLHAYSREPFKVPGMFPSTELRESCQPQTVTLWVDDRRRAVRAAYRPDRFAVVSSLLLDSASVAGHDEWLGWAEEMGALSGSPKPADLRRLRTGFAQAKEHRAKLRRILGPLFDRAVTLAGML